MLWMTRMVWACFTVLQFHHIACLLKVASPEILAWELLLRNLASHGAGPEIGDCGISRHAGKRLRHPVGYVLRDNRSQLLSAAAQPGAGLIACQS